jgi:beta-xylosidase
MGAAGVDALEGRWSRSVVGLLVLLLVVMTVAGAEKAPSSLVIPALPRIGVSQDVDQSDVADPFVLPVSASVAGDAASTTAVLQSMTATKYVRFGTTDWRSNVPTAVSTDLTDWTGTADALPNLPSWATPSVATTWGPAVLPTATGWVLFFATEEAASGLECIGRATASRPEGPYVDRSSGPLVCQRSLGGSIDPSVVRDSKGTAYLIWKNDGNAQGDPVSLWEQRLSPDGQQLSGTPNRLLSADEPWQHGIVESPAMLAASKGGWWLFYSGGFWRSAGYSTGLAYCSSIEGPCRETSTTPFLASGPNELSPGGLDTFIDSRGDVWATFSTFVLRTNPRRRGRFFRDRVLDIAPILSR